MNRNLLHDIGHDRCIGMMFFPNCNCNRKNFFLSRSDLQGIRTVAKKDGDDWVLNGSKTFITNGYMADVVIVVAITDTNAKSAAHGISLFLVESGMPGFKKGRKLEKIGFKAQVGVSHDNFMLSFESCYLVKISKSLA